MRLASAHKRAYTYKVTVPPAELAVSLDTLKSHLNITHTLTDTILTLYLSAAITFAEKYTGRDLITRTYQTKRDFFPLPGENEGYYSYGSIPNGASSLVPSVSSNVGFELRKSPLQSVSSITYIDTNNIVQTVPASIYYNTEETDYSEVVLLPDSMWPTDVMHRMQSITIEFIAGIGDTEADIPADWKIAIMEHAAMLWANRGDCSDSGCSKLIPAASKAFYETKRILRL
ncbi:MAG: phage head-tail connector protein [Gammaproteobacteria bacterium]|nr:phage head-tail connector protein [Gammaproteobacteria bacterium]